jgi:hypothetical protein
MKLVDGDRWSGETWGVEGLSAATGIEKKMKLTSFILDTKIAANHA